MTERLLMLCPYWPPMGGPGVQRAVKFAKYLPEFGVAPYVVTRKALAVEDESLVAEAAGVPVRAARHIPFQRLGRAPAAGAAAARVGRMKKVRDWMQVPDHVVSWVPFAVEAAGAWAAEISPTCLYSTSPYHSTHLAALRLKRRLGVPWICDFRDPWATDQFTAYPTQLHRRFNAWLEARVVAAADAVTVISRGMRDDFAARYPEHAAKLHVIYNGFDDDDFRALAAPPAGPPWTIRHLGTFYTDRKPDAFLRGLAAFRAAHAAAMNDFRVELYGSHNADVEARLKSLAAELGLEGVVRFLPYVPHSEALRLLGTSHALLLVPGPGATTVTGKLFEYLAARRPILATAPFPSGIDEIAANPLRAGDTPEAVAAALAKLHAALAAGSPESTLPAAADVARYSRRAAAGRLAALVNELHAAAANR